MNVAIVVDNVCLKNESKIDKTKIMKKARSTGTYEANDSR